ncbi:MAG: beta-lactamase family protein [Fimbriimonadaceae bacterium]|nr:beta-lactamase family protein [Fimbriimonadaceae bacterium]
MKSPLLLTLALFPLVASADGLDDLVRKQMEQEKIPGVALAVVKGGVLAEQRVYGYSDIESGRTVTPETRFRIASLSKQFCSLAILILEQEGRLKRSDFVTDLLPEAPPEWKGIQIHHLLAHQGGLEEPEGFSYSKEFSILEWLGLFRGKKPAFAPGERYDYSNFGYATLGLIVEKVSGKPLRDFVKERLFHPAGLTHSFYWDPALLPPDHAKGYNWSDGKFVLQQQERPRAFDGSGGIVSSLRDLILWEKALTNSFPSPALLNLAWTPNFLRDGKPTQYGYGFFIRSDEKGKKIWHSGTTFGFTSRFTRYLDEGFTVIVLRNGVGEQGGSQKMEEAIAQWVRDQAR